MLAAALAADSSGTLALYPNAYKKRLDGAGVGGLDVLGRRAVHEHAGDLHLAVGVERDQADVGLGEGLGRGLDLLEDLRRVGAAEHGQLVHRPVAVVLVAARVADADGVGVSDVRVLGGGELEGRDPAVAGDVVDLLGDLGLRQRGKVGEGLEEPNGEEGEGEGGGEEGEMSKRESESGKEG